MDMDKVANFTVFQPWEGIRYYEYIGVLLSINIIILFFCQNIHDAKKKQWISTVLGLIFIYSISGFFNLCHVFLFGLTGTIIVVITGKRACHIAAFIYMFTILTLYRMYANYYNDHVLLNPPLNMIQMALLTKVVGVAFEINNSHKTEDDSKNKKANTSEGDKHIDPSLLDILHYIFSLFGTITCYFSYQTFHDYLTLPFSKAVGKKFVVKKLLILIGLTCVFAWIQEHWWLEYSETPEFINASFLYQSLFIMTQYPRYVIWINGCFIFLECLCMFVGLGAYPVHGENKAGLGPSKNYSALKKTTLSEAEMLEYDYKTIDATDLVTVFTTPWMRLVIMSWNRTLQYFFWRCFYKSLPSTGSLRKYKYIFTIAASAIWHGLSTGFFLAAFVIIKCIWTQNVYQTICDNHLTGWRSNAIRIFMFFYRFYVLGFASMVFNYGDFYSVWKVCFTVYFAPLIYNIFVHLLGVAWLMYLNKNNKIKGK